MMTAKERLLLAIDQAPDAVLEMVLMFLMFVQKQVQTSTQSQPETPENISNESKQLPSFFVAAQRLSAELPEEAWKDWPADFSINLDHYLYGGSKVEE
jgi:hypothetical protein